MDPIAAFISENTTEKTSSTTTSAIKAAHNAEENTSGTLIFGGSLDFENMSAKPEGIDGYLVIDLHSPVSKSFSSSSSMHYFILLANGQLCAMGSNCNGQLGLGDLNDRSYPTLVPLPIGLEVLKVSCGRYHSLVLFSNGEVWGSGLNKSGQLGLGDSKILSGNIKSLSKIPLRDIIDCDAGFEHSIACDRSGKVFTWGSPQYGQLGHGSTGEYLKEGGKGKALQYNNVTSPRQVAKAVTKDSKGKVQEELALGDLKIGLVAAGKNHSLCVEHWDAPGSQNRCFSWGTGGYGRLGHSGPDDELVPREIIHFSPHVVAGEFKLNPTRQIRQIVAGSTFTVAITLTQQLYFWGKLSNSSRGESTMYPKIVDDLCNWRTQHVGAGSNLVVVAADAKVIAWGAPVSGLLGFEGGAKSSIPPKFLSALEGGLALNVSCGYGHVCFVVDPKTDEFRDKLAAMPRLMDTSATTSKKTSSGEAVGGKRAAKEQTSKPAAKKAKGK